MMNRFICEMSSLHVWPSQDESKVVEAWSRLFFGICCHWCAFVFRFIRHEDGMAWYPTRAELEKAPDYTDACVIVAKSYCSEKIKKSWRKGTTRNAFVTARSSCVAVRVRGKGSSKWFCQSFPKFREMSGQRSSKNSKKRGVASCSQYKQLYRFRILIKSFQIAYLHSRVNDSKVSGFRVNDPQNMRFRVSDFKMSGLGLTTPKCQVLGFRVSNSKLQISRFTDSNMLGFG